MLIDHPKPDETPLLIDFARRTGFFRQDEIDVIKELLDKYESQVREMGEAGWESGEYVWIVYREGPGTSPLGMACYGAVEMSEDVYDLYWIVVDPAHQDKKIGSALLRYIEEDLQKRHGRQLYIETSDTEQYAPTRAFYLRRGYEQVGHMTDFYRIGDGKVVYRKVFRST